MPLRTRRQQPALAAGMAARLRLWSRLWQRYASGEHLDVSGTDAVRALQARRRPFRPDAEDDHVWRF